MANETHRTHRVDYLERITDPEPPTHRAEVLIFHHNLAGRWPRGMPDLGTIIEVHTSAPYGFLGFMTYFQTKYSAGANSSVTMNLIGRPVERRELSRDSIAAREICFHNLDRPQMFSTPRGESNQFYKDFMRFTDPSLAEPPKQKKSKLPKFGEMPVRFISA